MDSNDVKNLLRAGIGQGTMMGWGDEAEALAASIYKGTKKEDEIKRIRKTLAKYQQENPKTALGAELVGGAIPLLGSYLLTAGTEGVAAPTAAATTARTVGALSKLAQIAKTPVAKGIAAGATQGAIQGAGAAEEGNRVRGATSGGILGGVLGGLLPIAGKGAASVGRWAHENMFPTDKLFTTNAARRIYEKMQEAGMSTKDIENIMKRDRSLGVPSTMANADPLLVQLAETAAQRSGRSATNIEKVLGQQRRSTKARIYNKVQKNLHPGDYFEDEAKMVKNLKDKSKNLYDEAYAVGEVNDPEIISMLQMPEYKDAFDTARKLANYDAAVAKVEGGNPDAFKLRDIYQFITDDSGKIIGIEPTGVVPDVRTLDYMKRALDKRAMTLANSNDSVDKTLSVGVSRLRNALRDKVKSLVPEYENALKIYSDDSSIIKAMRSGYNEFSKMPHEQVVKLVANMSNAEKDAFRTGVARDIYGQIEKSARIENTADKFLGKEYMDKLKPLFDNEDSFNMFKSALERESQLFRESNKIIGGSQTSRRDAAREVFEKGNEAGQFVSDLLNKGFFSSLTSAAARAASHANMNNEVAARVSDMLMSQKPQDVAAAVKIIEDFANKEAQSVYRRGAVQAGATGSAVAITSPEVTSPELNNETNNPFESDVAKRQKEMERSASGESGLTPEIERAIQLRLQDMNKQ